MNRHRMAAMVAAVGFAGFMHTLAAQEITVEASQSKGTDGQNISSEQKPPAETPAPAATAPVQALAQPDDKLLSEMKVYPSF